MDEDSYVIPLDEVALDPPEGFSFTWEQLTVSCDVPPWLIVLNVFQFSGLRLYFLRSFGGLTVQDCLDDFSSWLDGEINTEYFDV